MILAVDFDGTLTENGFYPYSGVPNDKAKKSLKRCEKMIINIQGKK